MRTPRERGLALVAVLWVAMLMALLAAQVTRLSRSDLDLARNLVEGSRAELAADSALWTAIYTIVNDGPQAWRMDGTVYAWRLGEAEVRVRVTEEFSRIDINAAHPALLASLFRAVGIDPAEATALSEAVAPLQDQTTVAPTGFGPVLRARDRTAMPFHAVEQLYQLPGMSPELFSRVAPALTVHTGNPWPKGETLSPLVLAATEGRVLEEEFRDGSGDGLAPPADDVQSLDGSPAVLSEPETSGDPIYSDMLRIEAEALTAEEFHFAREAVIEFGTRSKPPWEFHGWRRGSRVLFPAPAERQ